MDRLHAVHNIERKTSWRIRVVPGGGWQKFKQHQGPIIYGQKFCQELRKQLNEKKSSIGLLKNENSTMLESLKGIYFIDPDDKEFQENIKRQRKVGTYNGS